VKKKLELPQITAELMEYAQDLQWLSGHLTRLGNQISTITDKLCKIDQNLESVVSADRSFNEPDAIPVFRTRSCSSSNIIPFKYPETRAEFYDSRMEQFLDTPVLAMPGKPLLMGIFDFRPLLQRDGLILLSWDKRNTEMGEYYTAYWVTSIGIPRFYASIPCTSEDFYLAQPHHKSYAAEDGIEFYGQDEPNYVVHVAPELMKSNPRHGELRMNHINTLKRLGSMVNFDYEYLLTKEKKRDLPVKKSKGKKSHRAGA